MIVNPNPADLDFFRTGKNQVFDMKSNTNTFVRSTNLVLLGPDCSLGTLLLSSLMKRVFVILTSLKCTFTVPKKICIMAIPIADKGL